jgi:uncharacterized damage-inducible protein DinB
MGARETLQPMFQMIWTTAVKNVEAMPEEGVTFKPQGLETRTFAEIAVHMANSCCMFGDNIGKTAWERVVAFPPDQFRSKSRILDAMRRGGERFLAGLSRLTDEEATRIVKAPWGAEMPQGQVVAGLVSHAFYHNGQLAVYLRMRGVKPLFVAM